MRCSARVIRTYKTTKADVCWPECGTGPLPENLRYPECGGEITTKLVLENEPYFGGCGQRLAIEHVCTKCKAAYFPGILELTVPYDGFDLTPYLDGCGCLDCNLMNK